MRCPLPTKMAGLNLALGRAGVWVPLYCTLKQLTESVLIHLGLFSQSEQMKSERTQSLTCSRKRKTYDLNATNVYERRNGQRMFWRASVSCGMDYVWRLHAADMNENGRCVVISCCWTGGASCTSDDIRSWIYHPPSSGTGYVSFIISNPMFVSFNNKINLI